MIGLLTLSHQTPHPSLIEQAMFHFQLLPDAMVEQAQIDARRAKDDADRAEERAHNAHNRADKAEADIDAHEADFHDILRKNGIDPKS